MNQVQYSIAEMVKTPTGKAYYFLFRTDWSDSHPDNLEKTLLKSFPSPDYNITKSTRSLQQTHETLK